MSDKRRAEQVDEVLDGLSSPSVAQVSTAMREFDADDVAAAAAHRALGGGGAAYVQSDDPGAVGAGKVWVMTSGISGTAQMPVLVRNADDDGWIESGLAHYDDDGQLRAFVTMSDTAIVIEKKDADGAVQSYFLIADDRVYVTTNGQPIWLGTSGLGAANWGISNPSGAEKFADIAVAPDDGEVSSGQRIHWFESATGLLRFKQLPDDDVLVAGHSLGITDAGVIKLPNLPTSDPSVADQLWNDAGVLKVSAGP